MNRRRDAALGVDVKRAPSTDFVAAQDTTADEATVPMIDQPAPAILDAASVLDGPSLALDKDADTGVDTLNGAALDGGELEHDDVLSDRSRDLNDDEGADVAPDVAHDVHDTHDAVEMAPSTLPVTFVAAGAVWHYLDTGLDLGEAWRAPSFDDSAWPTGRAELGYGDGDEATTVSFGTDRMMRHTTTYFRRSFTVTSLTGVRTVVLRLLRDDGAVVYLNGSEVFRSNVPPGDITAATFATTPVGDADESRFYEALVDPSRLNVGVNTLAVEVHQATPDSSDLSFDLALVGYDDLLALPEVDPVFVGAGDIAHCGDDNDELTARLLDRIPGTVFAIGDTVYYEGTDEQYRNCYEPTWGRHRARTRPAVGNHEYLTPGAAGYYRYFGAAAGDPARGYYSYDLGMWHIVSLNSNCETVSCALDSEQERWLVADLAMHPTRCTLAYWHHPRFTSGVHGPYLAVDPLIRRLYEAGVDVVLNGHEHHYERFAPMSPEGSADASRGIRFFVVGTGGIPLRYFPTVAANSEVRSVEAHGVLRMVLHPSSYEWRFIPIAGRAFSDSGVASCH